jgi:hypothetical protein
MDRVLWSERLTVRDWIGWRRTVASLWVCDRSCFAFLNVAIVLFSSIPDLLDLVGRERVVRAVIMCRGANYTLALRKIPVDTVLADMIKDFGPPSTTATPRNNIDPSSPPAESCGNISTTQRPNGPKSPTDSPDEASVLAFLTFFE